MANLEARKKGSGSTLYPPLPCGTFAPMSRDFPLMALFLLDFLLLPFGPGMGPLAGQEPVPAAVSSDPGAVFLRPGDALEIQIWREAELSGRFVVDKEGFVTLPLLGRIVVTGIPVEVLREDLFERYRRELRNPSISITPLRRVYVLGHVNQPGLLGVDPTITLAGAIAMAGGIGPEGRLEKLTVLRNGEVLFDELGPEMDLLSIDIRSGDQILVGRQGWFERNSAFLVSAVVGAAGIVVTLLR